MVIWVLNLDGWLGWRGFMGSYFEDGFRVLLRGKWFRENMLSEKVVVIRFLGILDLEELGGKVEKGLFFFCFLRFIVYKIGMFFDYFRLDIVIRLRLVIYS